MKGSRAPADASNRINAVRLWWFALTRADKFADVKGFEWLKNDEWDNVNPPPRPTVDDPVKAKLAGIKAPKLIWEQSPDQTHVLQGKGWNKDGAWGVLWEVERGLTATIITRVSDAAWYAADCTVPQAQVWCDEFANEHLDSLKTLAEYVPITINDWIASSKSGIKFDVLQGLYAHFTKKPIEGGEPIDGLVEAFKGSSEILGDVVGTTRGRSPAVSTLDDSGYVNMDSLRLEWLALKLLIHGPDKHPWFLAQLHNFRAQRAAINPSESYISSLRHFVDDQIRSEGGWVLGYIDGTPFSPPARPEEDAAPTVSTGAEPSDKPVNNDESGDTNTPSKSGG